MKQFLVMLVVTVWIGEHVRQDVSCITCSSPCVWKKFTSSCGCLIYVKKCSRNPHLSLSDKLAVDFGWLNIISISIGLLSRYFTSYSNSFDQKH